MESGSPSKKVWVNSNSNKPPSNAGGGSSGSRFRPPSSKPQNSFKPRSNDQERAVFTKNRGKFDHDESTNKSGNNKNENKEWKSGYVFGQYNRRPQRNDPWWMRCVMHLYIYVTTCAQTLQSL